MGGRPEWAVEKQRDRSRTRLYSDEGEGSIITFIEYKALRRPSSAAGGLSVREPLVSFGSACWNHDGFLLNLFRVAITTKILRFSSKFISSDRRYHVHSSISLRLT
jgi:hypothetical protein